MRIKATKERSEPADGVDGADQANQVEETKEPPAGQPQQNGHDVEMKEQSPRYEDYEEEVDWAKCLERAVQFSSRKSEMSTRRSARKSGDRLDSLNLQSIKDRILDLESDYTEASREIGKSWTPYSGIDEMRNIIEDAEDEETLRDALDLIERGFSNPMNVKAVEEMPASARVERDMDSQSNASGKPPANKRVYENGLVFFRNNRKIKKFWSSDALKDSWREYNSNIQNGSISALFLSVCIFADQAEDFIEKLNSKLEKRNKETEELKCKDKLSK